MLLLLDQKTRNKQEYKSILKCVSSKCNYEYVAGEVISSKLASDDTERFVKDITGELDGGKDLSRVAGWLLGLQVRDGRSKCVFPVQGGCGV